MSKSTKYYTLILNILVILYAVIPGDWGWFKIPAIVVGFICSVGLFSDMCKVAPKSTSIDTSKLKD